ncbi:DUF805 domain-containing protein [Methylacidiphilum caldifontis]|uniref:DUF805 domain-containing protein n=1 Tax=Methylacidiphilum caldifontis TaxID=2795386 RepID=A0A4Y8PHV9_9BACT|nr:DUF805 domain-containing protein [Methylacidiphilum caldifontis]TFE73102.1 hypothetical protein A7Q10_10485 [Methylacidiphilum caldifontis]
MEAYLEAWKKYAVFDGRASRPEFWLFYLINLVVTAALGLFGVMTGLHFLLPIYDIAVFLPSWAVQVRRLHDTGRSGWNMLWGLLPVIGWIVLIVFLAEKGHTGQNQYGSDPRKAA